jgi:hypothetical protein
MHILYIYTYKCGCIKIAQVADSMHLIKGRELNDAGERRDRDYLHWKLIGRDLRKAFRPAQTHGVQIQTAAKCFRL